MPRKGKPHPSVDPSAAVRKVAATVERLHRRGAVRPLKRILGKLHPADLAAVLSSVPDVHVMPLFGSIPGRELAAEVLVELPPRTRDRVVEETPIERLVQILEELPPDDLTDLVQGIDPELSRRLMALLEKDSKREVEDLLRYTPDTAGGLMTPDFFALAETVTVQQAIAEVRTRYDVEMVFYVYVIDGEGHLVGVVSLRQLLLTPGERTLAEIMNRRIISVRTDTAQEQVAEIVDKYQLLAVPVVDEHDVLVGMVTVDDVIEAIEAITTKEMLRMAGTDESEIATQSSFRIARIRLPWLGAAFAGGLVATAIIEHFEPLLAKVLALSAFLPVVMGMAGNVGVQSATVAVRGLATGSFELDDAARALFRELRVGLLLGAFYGAVLAGFGWYFYGDADLARVVGLTILVNMGGAAALAILLPLLFHRIGTDPAIATGPFVTTAIDVLGVLNYFLIAGWVLELV